MSVPHLTTLEDYQKALLEAGPNLIVIDFYADWCLKSQQSKKDMIKLQEEMPDGNLLI